MGEVYLANGNEKKSLDYFKYANDIAKNNKIDNDFVINRMIACDLDFGTLNQSPKENYIKAKKQRELCNFKQALHYFREALEKINPALLEEETTFTEAIEKLFQMLKNFSNNEDLAKKQILIISKKLISNNLYLINTLIKRGRFYEMNVVENFHPKKWTLNFIKCEIQGRLLLTDSETVESDSSKLEASWISLINYHGEKIFSAKIIENILIRFTELQEKSQILPKDSINNLLFMQMDFKKLESMDLDDICKSLKFSWIQSFIKTRIDEENFKEIINLLNFKPFENDYSEFREFLRDIKDAITLQDLLIFLRFIKDFGVEMKFIQIASQNLKPECEKSQLRYIVKSLKALFIETIFIELLPKTQKPEDKGYLLNSLMSDFKLDSDAWLKFLFLLKTRVLELKNYCAHYSDLNSLFENLKLSLRTIYRYKLFEKENFLLSLSEIVQNNEIKYWSELFHKFAIKNYFEMENEQTFEQFIAQIKSNESNQDSDIIITIDSIKIQTEKIFNFSESEYLKAYNEYDIKRWAINAKNYGLDEKIAVICRAFELVTKFKPKKTQILICLAFYYNEGLLARINTGEGKSWIVAIIAILKCLDKNVVDIVTSSSILAQRDAENFEKLYSLFNLKCDYIKENEKLKCGGLKPCYSANILYGDAFSFEADILRHEYSGENTRGNRSFDFVIVDEVDSMLIDQSDHTTRLVDRMPSMENLEPIYGLIMLSVKNFVKSCVQINNELFIPSECGNFDKFNNILVKLIPENKRILDNLTIENEEDLKDYLRRCADELSHTLKANKHEIVNYLKGGEVDGSEEFLEEYSRIENIYEIDEQNPIIESYINDQTSTNDNNIPALIAKFLKVKFNIFNIDDGDLCISSQYTIFNLKKLLEINILVVNDIVHKLEKIENFNKMLYDTVSKEVLKIVDFEPFKDEQKDIPKLKMPFHLKDIVENKMKVWIKSALDSMRFEADGQFILKFEGGYTKIKPVDFENTGVTQENTVFSDGIHQFLEIQNKLSITPESFSSNFMSNMTFFRRYINNFESDEPHVKIWGMTGTLGSKSETEMLKSLYKVKTIDFPTDKMRRHFQLRNVIKFDENSWYDAIVDSSLIEIKANRAVLLICEHIFDIEPLTEKLKSNNYLRNECEFLEYNRSDDSEGIENKIIGKNTIILATNLAGRGTDIKLSDEVIENGGLHVCITFIPKNIRVEEQARGRASRQGQPGSTEMIICYKKDYVAKEFFKNKDLTKDMVKVFQYFKVLLKTSKLKMV